MSMSSRLYARAQATSRQIRQRSATTRAAEARRRSGLVARVEGLENRVLLAGAVADVGSAAAAGLVLQVELAGTMGPLASAPAAPGNCTAARNGTNYTSIRVSWNDVSGETEYRIQYHDATTSTFASVPEYSAAGSIPANTTSVIVHDLKPGGTYTFRVLARNSSGDSPWSNYATASLPDCPPSNVRATAVGITSFGIAYDASPATSVSYYEVYVSTSGGTFRHQGDPIGLTWTIDKPEQLSTQALAPNTLYSIRVRTMLTNGITSGWSNTIDVVTDDGIPDAPPNFSVVTNGGAYSSVIAQWSDVSGEDEYRIQYHDSSSSAFVSVPEYSAAGSIPAGTTLVRVHDLYPGETYTFRVLARNNTYGDSPWSNEASFTLPDCPPGNLHTTAVGPNHINVAWDASPSTSVDHYEVYVATNGGPFRHQGDLTGLSWTIDKPEILSTEPIYPGTRYDIRVRTILTTGMPSGYTSAITVVTPDGKPTQPQNLSAESNGGAYSSILVRWADAADENEYVLQYHDSTSSTFSAVPEYSAAGSIPAGSTYVRVHDLHPGETYTFRILARNGYGDSAWSNESGFTLADCQPSNLHATEVGPNYISIAWDASPAAASDVDHYDVYVSTNGGPFRHQADVTGLSWTIDKPEILSTDSIHPSTPYAIRVRTILTTGMPSSYTPTISVVTEDGIPTMPSIDNVEAWSETDVDVYWTHDGHDVVNYTVEWQPLVAGHPWSPSSGAKFSGAIHADKRAAWLSELTPTTLYGVSVRAEGVGGNSDWTPPVYVITWGASSSAPINDNFAERAILRGSSVSDVATNLWATEEEGEPIHGGEKHRPNTIFDPDYQSIWWSWTAPFTGRAQIDTIGSDFDTDLGVYVGDSLASLSVVGQDYNGGGHGTSKVVIPVTAGTTYQIAVDGSNDDTAIVHLNIAPVASPSNDDFSNSTPLSGLVTGATGTNRGAGRELDEPFHGTVDPYEYPWAGTYCGGSSVWWTWTAPQSGMVSVDTQGSDFFTMLGVYTGSALSSLNMVARGTAYNVPDHCTSTARFIAVAGTTYHIAVDGNDGAMGNARLNVTTLLGNPTDISLDGTSVREHLPSGTLVGNFTTSDSDVGDSFTYTLLRGSAVFDMDSFAIVGNQLLTTASFDCKTQSQYYIRVRTTDSHGLWYEKDFVVNVTEGTPPAVVSAVVNDGSVQRSVLNKVLVTFSEPVLVTGNAISVVRRNGAAVAGVMLSVTNPSGDQKTWEVTFGGTATQNGSLPDGMYKLIVGAVGVTDLAGNPLTGDYSQRFFRLFGDYDGNRVVNRGDLVALRQALGQPASAAQWFDYDGNGTIDRNDLLRLRARLQRRLL